MFWTGILTIELRAWGILISANKHIYEHIRTHSTTVNIVQDKWWWWWWVRNEDWDGLDEDDAATAPAAAAADDDDDDDDDDVASFLCLE